MAVPFKYIFCYTIHVKYQKSVIRIGHSNDMFTIRRSSYG